ncbi:hypothetical protein BH23CHL2_BH23CHL2_21140 [soil metagenome]
MGRFETKMLSLEADGLAPDGSEVRLLLEVREAGMAHFTLPPGKVSHAVTHRTVEELWYVLTGFGRMWRKQGDREEIVELGPDVCLSIPLGTHFQFRNDGEDALEVVIATIPTWPGTSEAVPIDGPWEGREVE